MKNSQKPGAGKRSRTLPVVVRRSPLGCARAIVRLGAMTFPAAIGRSGITSRKREGDGATPRASMPLIFGFCRSDRIGRPLSRLELVPIRADMGWCDAPRHASYNRLVRLPFGPGHEVLRRSDHLYDICLVMDWNLRCRRRGAGSAIFLHVARPGFLATEGCVAVSRRALARIAAHAGPRTRVIVG